MSKKNKIAIFDFDGTLTRHDTFIPFLFHCFGTIKVLKGFLFYSPFIFAYLLKIIPNYEAKNRIVKYFFLNQNIEDIEKLSESFVNQKIKKFLRPNVYKKLKWHQKRNHTIILISASLEMYIRPWAKNLNIDYIECTELQTAGNKFNGLIKGINCHGEEKVKRIKNILKNKTNSFELFGYGDSKSDLLYINFCNHKYYKKDLNYL